MIALSVTYQVLPVLHLREIESSRGSRKFFFFFYDVTELSIECQVAYVPERGSSQHVVQKRIFCLLRMRLNSINDTKLPTYLKGDQVNT